MPPQIVTTDMAANANIGRYSCWLPITLVNLTDALQYTLTPGHKGRLLAMRFHTHVPASTASKLSTLTPSISAVNMTGGVVALTTATSNVRGEITESTAVTGLNSFTSAQSVAITASATTAFVEGSGVLEVVLVNDDTREAVARANGGQRTGTE